MIRIVLWSLFIFSLPFLVALFWLAVIKRTHPSQADLKIWTLAGSAGLVLVLSGLFVLRAHLGFSPDYQYMPATIQDGALVPGYFVPSDKDTIQ